MVTKDGEKAGLSAVTVGSFVHAVGAVADDGTTLEAARIHVGQPGKPGQLREKRGRGEAPPAGLGPDGDLEGPGGFPEA